MVESLSWFLESRIRAKDENMFDLLAFNVAENQSMESISEGELNAGSTEEDIPGKIMMLDANDLWRKYEG